MLRLIPARRDASGLTPRLTTWRPQRVRVWNNQPSSSSTAAMATGYGMLVPGTVPRPILASPGPSRLFTLPSPMTKTSPRTPV